LKENATRMIVLIRRKEEIKEWERDREIGGKIDR
jgi:hypothetical protein